MVVEVAWSPWTLPGILWGSFVYLGFEDDVDHDLSLVGCVCSTLEPEEEQEVLEGVDDAGHVVIQNNVLKFQQLSWRDLGSGEILVIASGPWLTACSTDVRWPYYQ